MAPSELIGNLDIYPQGQLWISFWMLLGPMLEVVGMILGAFCLKFSPQVSKRRNKNEKCKRACHKVPTTGEGAAVHRPVGVFDYQSECFSERIIAAPGCVN